MKTKDVLRNCVVLHLLTIFTQTAGAETQYAIASYSIDAGGGTSTGGPYALSSSIGQPEAGTPMTNGQYSVSGGFPPMPLAVQTPGAPILKIALASSGHVMISWSPDMPGFVLQERLNFSPANWVNSLSGATNPVVVPAASPTKFYRLFKP